MAGQSSFRVIGAATTRSRGVRFGEIDAMHETERAIRTAVQAAQKMANVRVDHVIACFAGAPAALATASPARSMLQDGERQRAGRGPRAGRLRRARFRARAARCCTPSR